MNIYLFTLRNYVRYKTAINVSPANRDVSFKFSTLFSKPTPPVRKNMNSSMSNSFFALQLK